MKANTNEIENIIKLLEMLKTMTADEQKLALMLVNGYSAGVSVKNSV